MKRGKTPVLSPEEAHELFAAIPTDTLVGLRDRAVIGVLIYSFARVSAPLGMRAEDYFPQGQRWWLRLHEKGGKQHEMPVHHTLEEYLDSYIAAAGLLKEPKGPLFRASNGKTKLLSDRPFERRDALKMVQRRAKATGTPWTWMRWRKWCFNQSVDRMPPHVSYNGMNPTRTRDLQRTMAV